MILKIVEIKKTYEPYAMNNGGKIFSIGGTVEVDGQVVIAKVRAFTDKIKLEVGQTFETGKTCENIKHDTETYNGTTYQRYSIYAKKTEMTKQSSSWKPAPKISVQEFEAMISWCDARSRNLGSTQEQAWQYFATLLKSAERVDWSDKPVAPDAPIAFEDSNPSLPDEAF